MLPPIDSESRPSTVLCPEASLNGSSHNFRSPRLWGQGRPSAPEPNFSDTLPTFHAWEPWGQTSSSLQSAGGSQSSRRSTSISNVSSFTTRANERLDDFVSVLHGGRNASKDPGGKNAAEQTSSHVYQEQSSRPDVFGDILKQVDALRGEGSVQTTNLQQNKAVEDVCAKNCHKLYKVALPTKPSKVHVCVTRLYGDDFGVSRDEGTLTIYGSVETDKPSARNHQYTGEEQIEYTHAYATTQTNDETGGLIDRRKVVPPHKHLFVSVESAWADCRYKICCMQSKVSILLTKAELRERPNTIPLQEWQKRLNELKHDAGKAYEFETRVKKHQMAQRKRLEGEKNMMQSNMDHAFQCSPQRNHNALVSRRIQKLERENKVKACQNDLSEQLHERRTCWLQRAEKRAEKRREEEERQRAEFEFDKRCSDWFLYLFINMQTRIMAERFMKQKKAIQEWWEQNFAAGQIQSGWVKKYSKQRRHYVYRNVYRMRTGMSAYVRHMQTFVRIRSALAIGAFLESCFVGASIDSSQSIRRFLWNVKVVQRRWRKVQTIRTARVEVYTNVMRTIEPELVKLQPRGKDKKKGPSYLPDVIMAEIVLDLVKKQQRLQIEAWEAWKKDNSTESISGFQAALNKAATLGNMDSSDFTLEAPRATAFYVRPQECRDILLAAHENWRSGNFDKLLEAAEKKNNGEVAPPQSRTPQRRSMKIDMGEVVGEERRGSTAKSEKREEVAGKAPDSPKEDGDGPMASPEVSSSRKSQSGSKSLSSSKPRKSKRPVVDTDVATST